MNMWKFNHHQLTKQHQRQSFSSSVNCYFEPSISKYIPQALGVLKVLESTINFAKCVSPLRTLYIVKATEIISAVNYAVYHNVHGIHEIYT